MTTTRSRFVLLFLAALATVPAFGAIAPELTIPVGGYLKLPNDVTYRTEYVITNHRDVPQYVAVEMIADGKVKTLHIFSLDPHQTRFRSDGSLPINRQRNEVGAYRFRAIFTADAENETPNSATDTAGLLEVSSYIVSERGPLGRHGTSRQEVASIPASEYTSEEMIFVGIRHDLPTYTNVGIVNLHATQTETFFVEFQYTEPIAVSVPPLSSRQIRLPGPGNGGRSVKVYPAWSIGAGAPARTTPWVAYASTVDGLTGDAFSGTRAPGRSQVD